MRRSQERGSNALTPEFRCARTFHQLSNDISEESKIVDQYSTSCKKERLELDKLRLQKIGLESLTRQFQNNNESLQMIKDLVKQTVEQSLMNHRDLLSLAFLDDRLMSKRSYKIQYSLS